MRAHDMAYADDEQDIYDPREDCGLQDLIDREDEYVCRLHREPVFNDDEEELESEPAEPVDNDNTYGFPEFHRQPVYRKTRQRKKKH